MTDSELTAIEQELRSSVAREVRLRAEGTDRFRVFTPFQFDDGDHLAIVLRRNNGHWEYSDEAHTLMHLSYWLSERELGGASRQKIISNALASFDVENSEGELVLTVTDGNWGASLFSYIQALLRISDVSVLSRERVKSTFVEDVRSILTDCVPADQSEFQWHDRERDPTGKYTVDCRINGHRRPLMVFWLATDSRTRDATIVLHQLEKWGLPHRSLAIFQDQERISRSVLARFSDVVDKQFSSISERERIAGFLRDSLSGQ